MRLFSFSITLINYTNKLPPTPYPTKTCVPYVLLHFKSGQRSDKNAYLRLFYEKFVKKDKKCRFLGFKRVFQGGFGGESGKRLPPQIRKGLMHKKIGAALSISQKPKSEPPHNISNLLQKYCKNHWFVPEKVVIKV